MILSRNRKAPGGERVPSVMPASRGCVIRLGHRRSSRPRPHVGIRGPTDDPLSDQGRARAARHRGGGRSGLPQTCPDDRNPGRVWRMPACACLVAGRDATRRSTPETGAHGHIVARGRAGPARPARHRRCRHDARSSTAGPCPSQGHEVVPRSGGSGAARQQWRLVRGPGSVQGTVGGAAGELDAELPVGEWSVAPLGFATTGMRQPPDRRRGPASGG
jgi:hypothetical protein